MWELFNQLLVTHDGRYTVVEFVRSKQWDDDGEYQHILLRFYDRYKGGAYRIDGELGDVMREVKLLLQGNEVAGQSLEDILSDLDITFESEP